MLRQWINWNDASRGVQQTSGKIPAFFPGSRCCICWVCSGYMFARHSYVTWRQAEISQVLTPGLCCAIWIISFSSTTLYHIECSGNYTFKYEPLSCNCWWIVLKIHQSVIVCCGNRASTLQLQYLCCHGKYCVQNAYICVLHSKM